MASLSFIPAGKLADLLRSADPQNRMYVRVLSATRLAIGADPLQPTSVIDLAKETVGPIESPQKANDVPSDDHAARGGGKITRRSGEYWFEIRGKRTECSSLKNLLAEGLLALEGLRPGTLDSLSRVKGRSRRIVAREANHLFDKPHLVKDYAERLQDGWYFGTNNSARETNVWLNRAAECAGLKFGEEFRTSLGPAN